ncbi:N-isopropylammelide isopropylaminohydrolase, partial [Micrococcus endophyticus]
LLATLAELDVALTTIAPAGAGTLPLDRILQAGVRLGLGEDGQRDYWSPYGNADLVDRAWQLAFTQGFRADDDVARCLEVAAVGGRSV